MLIIKLDKDGYLESLRVERREDFPVLALSLFDAGFGRLRNRIKKSGQGALIFWECVDAAVDASIITEDDAKEIDNMKLGLPRPGGKWGGDPILSHHWSGLYTKKEANEIEDALVSKYNRRENLRGQHPVWASRECPPSWLSFD